MEHANGGGVGLLDTATLGLLNRIGFGGGGGGYGYGNYGGGHGGSGYPFGHREVFDGSVNNAKQESIERQVTTGHAALAAEISRSAAENRQAINQARQDQILESLKSDIADSRAETAKCCCETQLAQKDTLLKVSEENGLSRALILEQSKDDLARQVALAHGGQQTTALLDAINNLGQSIRDDHHHHRRGA